MSLVPGEDEVSEAEWERMVEEDPDTLFALVGGGNLRISDLTFAAEILGRSKDTARVLLTLIPLLASPSPLVREGAVLGLAHHPTTEVEWLLRRLISSEQCDPVRRVMKDVLEEIAENRQP